MRVLVDDIRSHLRTMAPHQRRRLTALQLQKAADCIDALTEDRRLLTAEVQQLRGVAAPPSVAGRGDTQLVALSYDVEGVLAPAADSTWVTVGADYAVYIKKDSDGVSAAIYVNGIEDCEPMAECWATAADVNDMRTNYSEQE